jgi:hypothetical protein
LVLLVLLAFAASASAATMTPLSDTSLSAVSAGNGDSELEIEVEIEDFSQQYVRALNLINAGGAVQVGTNVFVATAECVAGIVKAGVEQTVVNVICEPCSICEFDDVEMEVEVEDCAQQGVHALNVINTTGSAQVGTNIAGLCAGGAAGLYKAGLSQCVVNVRAGGD